MVPYLNWNYNGPWGENVRFFLKYSPDEMHTTNNSQISTSKVLLYIQECFHRMIIIHLSPLVIRSSLVAMKGSALPLQATAKGAKLQYTPTLCIEIFVISLTFRLNTFQYKLEIKPEVEFEWKAVDLNFN